MSEPTILIIGAGMAGLSAGCYARMNGYQTHIFELHTIPGGLCTAWRREGYLFDGAVRYLVGTGPHTRTYPMWRELGVMPGHGVHYYDEFICYEGRDGRAVHFYTNPDRLEEHLLALSPKDADAICDFTTALCQLGDFDLPLDLSPDDAREGLNFGRIMLGHALPLMRWMNVTVRDFAQRFRDPLLRDAFTGFFQCTPPDFPMLMMLMTLAPMGTASSGYPIGGSLAMAQAVAHRFHELGGNIHYDARVVEILVENNTAVGVRLANGQVFHGDIVISAADGHKTIFNLLNGRYVNDTLKRYYDELPVSESIMQFSIGVKRDMAPLPPMLDFPLNEPIDIGGVMHHRLVLKHYCFDHTMTDPGKSALTIWVETDYGYWHVLRESDEETYLAEKAHLGEQIINALDARFPGLANDVEVIDVATPYTYERYTENWRGSIHGWALGMQKMNFMMRMGMSKTLPNLRNFYMIGHWVEPAGNVQLSAASGRDVLEMICRQHQQSFQTGVQEVATHVA